MFAKKSFRKCFKPSFKTHEFMSKNFMEDLYKIRMQFHRHKWKFFWLKIFWLKKRRFRGCNLATRVEHEALVHSQLKFCNVGALGCQ
jgi:hypothetical protein